ncbi:MAG: hypothetical protein CVU57_13550 [Deltaproteobacteria bacterium HGW-Deltaproteobacteria-15]|jgi:nucleoside-diphosphate-sugar epimerase|nr:MAG: hypothetical protein CVU57_13550 [Deltaproteobacteria bacterium HGW-Deltaproteobacteria-15]
MHYVVAGATSGTGHAVIQRLICKVGLDHITCIVRPTSQTALLMELGLRLHTADITQPESYKGILGPSVVYLDMTHPKHYHKSLEAVVSSGIERAYFVTTTGIFSKYRRLAESYIENENRIRKSKIVYTILRPSMIYGTISDKNMHRLILFLDRFPFFPIFGGGKSLMQPVHVGDLSKGIVEAIDDPNTEYQEYNLAGPNAISYREIVNTIIQKLHRKVRIINVNEAFAYQTVRALQWIPGFPINDEQILRLREDKIFDISKSINELGFSPRSFDAGIFEEIQEMRFCGMVTPKLSSKITDGLFK